MKTESYLSTTDGAGDGTIVTCACVDLGLVDATRGATLHPRLPVAVRLAAGRVRRRGLGRGRHVARGLPRGRAGSADGRGRPVGGRTATRAWRTPTGSTADGELELRARRASASSEPKACGGCRWATARPHGGARCRWGRPASCRSRHAARDDRTCTQSGGRLTGFDVELAAAIARRLGLTLSWRDLPCQAALRAVSDGTLDAVLDPVRRRGAGHPHVGDRAQPARRARHLEATRPRAGRDRCSSVWGPHDRWPSCARGRACAWANDDPASHGSADAVHDRPARRLRGARRRIDHGRGGRRSRTRGRAIERRRSLRVAQSIDVGAHDVFVAKGPDARLVAAIDEALARLIRVGRYALLFAKYFPGTPVPAETGT